MALIFADSFDHLDQNFIQGKWTSISGFGSGIQGLVLDATHQRTGIQCGRFTENGAFKTIKNASTWIFGAAIQWDAYGGSIAFTNIATVQVLMTIRGDGTLAVFNGPHGFDPGTLLGATSPGDAIILGRYYYIEFKAKIHQTAGTVEVRINGQTVLSLTGVNTSPNGDNNADVLAITGPGGLDFMFMDDLYVNDDTGATNNDFLGDVRVGLIMAAVDGDFLNWTPSAGTAHFSLVNEIPPGGDSSYVSAFSPGTDDCYHFQTVGPNQVILAIQTNIIARKDDEGNRAVSLLTRFGGADSIADPTGRFANFTYIDYLNQFDVNPLTGLQWTPASLNATQWGYRIIA